MSKKHAKAKQSNSTKKQAHYLIYIYGRNTRTLQKSRSYAYKKKTTPQAVFVFRAKESHSSRRNSLLDIYFVRCNVAASELKIQTEEVSEVCWVHRNKLKQMIKSGEYHNYGEEYFGIIFDAFKKISEANRKRRKRRINGR